MTTAPSFEAMAAELDDAIKAVAELDEPARQTAERLREALESAHKQALTSMVIAMREQPQAREVLFGLVDDPLVRMLLTFHGIIRLPEPDVAAPAGGSCGSGGGQAAGPTFIPLTSLSVRRADSEEGSAPAQPEAPREPAEPGWIKTMPVRDVPDGEATAFTVVTADSTEHGVVLVRVGESIMAYRDECAHQGLPLGEALVDVEAGTLTCPWHGYCYDAISGDCMSAPGAALAQLPVDLKPDGHVWMRVVS